MNISKVYRLVDTLTASQICRYKGALTTNIVKLRERVRGGFVKGRPPKGDYRLWIIDPPEGVFCPLR